MKRVFGPFGYLVASLFALHALRSMKIEVQYENRTESYRAVQAGVIKGHSWMGGKLQIPGLSLEEACFAFYAVPLQSKWMFFRMVRRLMNSQFFHTSGLRAFLVSDITIKTRSPQPLVLDGDLCGQSPARIQVIPEALRVCVPAKEEAPGR